MTRFEKPKPMLFRQTLPEITPKISFKIRTSTVKKFKVFQMLVWPLHSVMFNLFQTYVPACLTNSTTVIRDSGNELSLKNSVGFFGQLQTGIQDQHWLSTLQHKFQCLALMEINADTTAFPNPSQYTRKPFFFRKQGNQINHYMVLRQTLQIIITKILSCC